MVKVIALITMQQKSSPSFICFYRCKNRKYADLPAYTAFKTYNVAVT